MSKIVMFQEEHPSLESYWRSVILFGRNVASYKFALSKTLLELAPTKKTVLTLEDLSEPFSRHLCEHLITAPRQATSRSSQFLETWKAFNQGEITKEQLLNITVQKRFVNVIDAFHNVNLDEIPIRFYQKDYGSHGKRIILTDGIYRFQKMAYYSVFMNETESRWNLVETSWELQETYSMCNMRMIRKNCLSMTAFEENPLLLLGMH